MKVIILLGTLKKDVISHTETLTEFFSEFLVKKKAECEIIKLVNLNIPAGIYSDMGRGDDWPAVLKKLKSADIIIFSTPIWWGNHSSETQKAMERLDEIYEKIAQGEASPFDGKVGGILITGDSDGAQSVIGNLSNFLISMGISVPAYCALSVIWSQHSVGSKVSRKQLLEKYQKECGTLAETMAKNLIEFAKS